MQESDNTSNRTTKATFHYSKSKNVLVSFAEIYLMFESEKLVGMLGKN